MFSLNNKNAKVEQLTNMLGRGVRLNVMLHLFWKKSNVKNVIIIIMFHVSAYFFVLQIIHVQLQNATRSIVMNLQKR